MSLSSADKMTIVIDAKDTASNTIIKLQNELAKFGGQAAVNAAKESKKLSRELKLLGVSVKTAGEEADKAKPFFGRFAQGIAVGNIAATAFTKAVGLLKDAVLQLNKATLVAAQIEELGHVYQFVGENAGYSKAQLKAFNIELREAGIRQDASYQSLLRGIQANIDLGDAVKFARIAQDAATVGLMESSEAYIRIIDSVAKLYPRLLKEIGIIINLNVEFAKYAKTIGKTVNVLSEAEKKQAMMNAIFEKGERLFGAYETAMEKVSKRIRSIPRWFMDAQQAVGRHFIPAMELAVNATEGFLKLITKAFGESTQKTIKDVGTKFELTADQVERLNEALDAGKISIETYQDKMKEALAGQGDIIEESMGEVLDFIIKTSKSAKEANEKLFIAYQARKIDASSWAKATGEMHELFNEMVRKSKWELVEGGVEWNNKLKAAMDALVITTETASGRIAGIIKEVLSHGEFGGVFGKTLADVKRYLIEEERFSQEEVDAFFIDPLKDSIEKGKQFIQDTRDELARMKAGVVRIELDDELHGDDTEAAGQAYIDMWMYLRSSELKGQIAHYEEMADLQKTANKEWNERFNEAAKIYEERWRFAFDAVSTFYHDFAEVLMTDTNDMAEALKNSFERIGRSIVHALIDKGIKALTDMIIADSAAIKASALLTKAQAAESVATVVNAVAKTKLAIATSGVAAASGAMAGAVTVAIGALATETAAAIVLTKAYIAAASAKAALTLGITAGPSIAAAASTKAALMAILTGFDDPRNDALAFRHGKDYAEQFMTGVKSILAAPMFGGQIVDFVNRGLESPAIAGAGAGGGTTISIHFEGPVTDERFVRDTIVPIIEKAIYDNGSNLLIDDELLTGGRDVPL